VHPDDLPGFIDKWSAALAQEKQMEIEVRLRHPAGGYQWWLIRNVPLRDEQGKIAKWYGSGIEIEDRKRAEEAARRSEHELRDLIETIPIMVFSAGADGTTHFVSRNWQDYSGMSLEQTTGIRWRATVHPDDIEEHMAKWRVSLTTGQPFENEVRHRGANGEYRWFLVRAVPLHDEQWSILRWYGVLTDIEDRKRAEALLAGEKRILEMVAKGDSLAQILDTLCRLVEEQAAGVLTSILLLEGNRLRHGGAPSLPKAYTDAIDGAEIGPSVGSCGTAAYRKEQVIVQDLATDPLWKDYRAAALPHSLRACWSTPILSSQGDVIATFAMYYREPRSPSARDQQIIEQITHLAGVAIERKLTQEALRRSEAYLAEAQRLTRTGSWAFDPRGDRMLFCSEEVYRIFAVEPQEPAPSIEVFLRRVHPEDRERVRQDSLRIDRDKAERTIEYRLLLPDATIKHVMSMRHPVFDGAGELVELIGTIVDVTTRKRAEAELERLHQLEADLARVNRVTTMGELTASLAHEINQPIAAAVTDANTAVRWLARDVPDIEEAREAAKRAAKDATRAAEIITRIRSLFSKGSSQRELIDLNEVVDEMISLLRSEAARYNISIEKQLDANLPGVMADRVQIQQVLMNLMLNSIDAMKGSDNLRKLKLVSERDGTEEAVISVSDTGIGVPQETGKIFHAFFTTKPHGTGMGLAISRTIIESHGGRLWTASNSGKGAVFYFALPATFEVK
jgi:PAS domain S-box-containing protein